MGSDSLVLTYRVTLEEFRDALKLWRKGGVNRAAFILPVVAKWTLTIFVLLAIGVLVIAAVRGTTRQFQVSLQNFAPLFILAAIFLVMTRLSGGRHFRASRLGEPAMLEAREDELRYQLQDGSLKVQYSWSSILKAVESPKMFVLMPSKRSILIVPKAQITPDASLRLAEILKQRNIPFKRL
ncbi:MAG: YcxB family protein [Acidobacteriaceae bacterium]